MGQLMIGPAEPNALPSGPVMCPCCARPRMRNSSKLRERYGCDPSGEPARPTLDSRGNPDAARAIPRERPTPLWYGLNHTRRHGFG